MKSIVAYYKDRLGIDLENLNHPLSAKIHSAFSKSGLDKKVNEFHLKHLGLSLFDILDFDKSIYNFYIKKIVNNAQIGVLGYIFEIIQCAHLINTSKKENLTFIFGDHNKKEADFIINGCGFEITSCIFSDESDKTKPGKKLLEAFRKKNNKGYANNDCVLIIEMSQITYHALANPKIDMSFNEVMEIIEKDSKFGLVICIVEWVDNAGDNIQVTAYQIYSEKCSSTLKELIENKFIKGQKNEFTSKPFIIPFT